MDQILLGYSTSNCQAQLHTRSTQIFCPVAVKLIQYNPLLLHIAEKETTFKSKAVLYDRCALEMA